MIHLNAKVKIPIRFVIWVMMFTSCFVLYMIKVNMSINLLAMVQPTKNNGTVSIPECKIFNSESEISGAEAHEMLTSIPDYGTRYNWDTKLQGLILGSYFWGYVITCIPGGLLAEKFGPTRVVMISTLISGILTIMGPVLSSWHYMALIISRFFIGLFGGVIYPCLHCMVSRWVPPEERGIFMVSLLGGALGTVTTWPLLGIIIENLGWSWSFYISGSVATIWSIFWILLVADNPDLHPRISGKEKSYIVNSLVGVTIKPTKGLPPYKSMFLSVPFWALIFLHFASGWGFAFIMTAFPNYLSTVLGFNIGHSGFLASVPYLARLILGFMFGIIGDVIRKKHIFSSTIIRKGFVLFSHIIPGILILVLNTTGCNVIWSITLFALSLGSSSADTLTNLQNVQDLAPNFAGTLFGIINCIGSTTGFVTPLIVGQLTAEHNGLREWHKIFNIGASVYIICGIIFCIFGSTELQRWNYTDESIKEEVDIGDCSTENTRETLEKTKN